MGGIFGIDAAGGLGSQLASLVRHAVAGACPYPLPQRNKLRVGIEAFLQTHRYLVALVLRHLALESHARLDHLGLQLVGKVLVAFVA